MARPFDRDAPDRAVQHERIGEAPHGAFRSDISNRVTLDRDGRGETASGDAAYRIAMPSASKPQGDRYMGALSERASPLPLKSDITNRVELRDGTSDDPKLARHDSVSDGNQHRKDYSEARPAPVAFKSDIAIKVGMASSDSEQASTKTLAAQPIELRGENAHSSVADVHGQRTALPWMHIETGSGSIGVLFNFATKLHAGSAAGDGDKDEL